MSIWIVTTGNSDVQLNTHESWEDFYEDVRYETNIQYCDKFLAIQQDKETQLFPVPARVLGIVYNNQFQTNYQKLAFPIIDTCRKFFHRNPNEKPSKIIVLLTDQRNIFNNQDLDNENCPFWQDTCTLENILKEYFQQDFKKYFQEHFQEYEVEILFFTLTPESGSNLLPEMLKGLDFWDSTLEVVDKTLSTVKETLDKSYDLEKTTIYVSHQAGTPAISSAVQFVSLSKFKNVKFLSSQVFYKDFVRQSEPELVDVSKYWQSIQIEKAKQLVKDGLPNVALVLLETSHYAYKNNVKERLEKMVEVFNLRESLRKTEKVDTLNLGDNLPRKIKLLPGNEFEVAAAIQRVVDTLSLIEIFFKEKNYLLGVTLLAAAQETFLKAAIVNEIKGKKVTVNYNGVRKTFISEQLIRWQQAGLVFIRKENDSYIDKELKSVLGIPDKDRDNQKLLTIKKQVLKQLSFPVDKFQYEFEKDTKAMNSNSGLLQWLQELRPTFKAWDLLKWSCIEKDENKEYNDDIRNQLVHNLLGVRQDEVVKYLLGNKSDNSKDVLATYQESVKQPCLNEIKELGLQYNERNLDDELQAIANDI